MQEIANIRISLGHILSIKGLFFLIKYQMYTISTYTCLMGCHIIKLIYCHTHFENNILITISNIFICYKLFSIFFVNFPGDSGSANMSIGF